MVIDENLSIVIIMCCFFSPNIFIHSISNTVLENLKKWVAKHGVTPRKKGSGGSSNKKNLLTAADVMDIVKFIRNYAEDHGVFLPGRIPGYKRSDLRLLPSSATKAAVYRVYKEAAEVKREFLFIYDLIFIFQICCAV